MMRGKPVGSHHRTGSFHSFSFREEPLLNGLASPVFVLRNFSKPHGVIGGRLLLVSFRAPDGSPVLVISQNPDRSCGSKGLFEDVGALPFCCPCLPSCAKAAGKEASTTVTAKVTPIERFSILIRTPSRTVQNVCIP